MQKKYRLFYSYKRVENKKNERKKESKKERKKERKRVRKMGRETGNPAEVSVAFLLAESEKIFKI